jgi:hypothetical protein
MTKPNLNRLRMTKAVLASLIASPNGESVVSYPNVVETCLKHGWIVAVEGEAKRYRITDAGRAAYAEAGADR